MTTETTTKGERSYNTSFAMYVASEEEEGLYNLYFHNCRNYDNNQEPLLVDFTVRLTAWPSRLSVYQFDRFVDSLKVNVDHSRRWK